MTERKLVATVVPKELKFPKQLGASITRTVQIKNNASNKSLAFKLQCNAPTRYAVTPASGVISPSSDQNISVRLKALESMDFENSSSSDKFLVRVTQLGPQEYDFPTESWSSVPKSAMVKYLIKVAFHSSPLADSKIEDVSSDPLKLSTNQYPSSSSSSSKQLWTPHSTSNNNNDVNKPRNYTNKMSRFSTPMAPETGKFTPAGQLKQAAQGLKKIWSERAIRKRGSSDSPQAANRYDSAVATVENVAALVNSNDDDDVNTNESRVIELLMKDGSRREEDKLSKEELHELIEYRGAVSDSVWQQWVENAQINRERNIDTSQQQNQQHQNHAKVPFLAQRNNSSKINRNRQAQSVGKIKTSKRFQIRKAPQSVKLKRNFIGTTRRNTFIGQHNAPVNTKFPPTQQRYNDSFETKADNRPPWEGVHGMKNPGSTRSSVLRKVLTRKPGTRSGISTAKKASIVRDYMENVGDQRVHSLNKKSVKFGYGRVAHAQNNGSNNLKGETSFKKGSSATQTVKKTYAKKMTKSPSRNMTTLTPTEKSLLEKVINYEARLDAVEAERSAMMSKIEEIAKKKSDGDTPAGSQITKEKGKNSSNASLSLADLTEMNPHDLANSASNMHSTNGIFTFEAEFNTPLGIVIGSRRIIKSVNLNSAALKKGLKSGDIILSVNGEDVPENISPQDLSSIISHKRDTSGFARLYLLRNKLNNVTESIVDNAMTGKISTTNVSTLSAFNKDGKEELYQARKKIVFLETQLELLNNADNTWKHKESLRKKLETCENENKDLRGKCQSLESDVLYLAGQLRGYSGRSSVVPEQIRFQFNQLRQSMKDTSEAVETIFSQVSRDLTIFSQHIIARAGNLSSGANTNNTFYKIQNKDAATTNRSRLNEGKSVVDVICVPRSLKVNNDLDDEGSIINVVNENSVLLKFGATPKQFTFSRALPTNSSGKEIFNSEIYEKIENILNGRSVCLFVHGEASERYVCPLLYGKDDDGVMRTAVQKLFEKVTAIDDDIILSVTAVECLNDQFRDLLQPPSENPETHELHRDGEGNVWVSNIVGVELGGIGDFVRVADICKGRQSLLTGKGKFIIPRRDSQTYLSRGCIPHPDAHLAITIQLDVKAKEGTTVLSRLTFVNLASGNNVPNQATLTGVGDVLENLAANNSFIPYRHAKLTRMLEPSLPKGKVDVVLVLSVSTAEEDVIETNRSLLFGRKLSKVSSLSQ